MAQVAISCGAVDDLNRLIATHRLPADTRRRFKSAIRSVGEFPHMGTPLHAEGWQGFRYIGGPWPWMISIYEYLESDDLVLIVSVEDTRASTAVLSR